MSNENNINLIQCADDGWAPWSIVCIHLIEGTSKEWVHIKLREDDLREVDGDWVCPDCYENIENPNIDDLRPICMHCVRKLKKKHSIKES